MSDGQARNRVSAIPHGHSRGGGTLVECSLLIAAVVLFAFGVLELGRIQLVQHAADDAVYQAACEFRQAGGTAGKAEAAAGRILTKYGIEEYQLDVRPPHSAGRPGMVEVEITINLDDNAWPTPRYTAGKQVSSNIALPVSGV